MSRGPNAEKAAYSSGWTGTVDDPLSKAERWISSFVFRLGVGGGWRVGAQRMPSNGVRGPERLREATGAPSHAWQKDYDDLALDVGLI